jgi:hypothetical protein
MPPDQDRALFAGLLSKVPDSDAGRPRSVGAVGTAHTKPSARAEREPGRLSAPPPPERFVELVDLLVGPGLAQRRAQNFSRLVDQDRGDPPPGSKREPE